MKSPDIVGDQFHPKWNHNIRLGTRQIISNVISVIMR
jgi:hypothetical protein